MSKAHVSFRDFSEIMFNLKKIIARRRNRFDLRAKESFFIRQLEPQSNVRYKSIKGAVIANNFQFIMIVICKC